MISKKIMVVDDEEDLLFVVTFLLQKEGFEVVTLNSPLDLIKKIEEHNPDVILLDVQMGEYDGRLLCQSIKELEAHTHRPVLLFSANKLYAGDVEKFKCDDFIEKPFDISNFVNRINYHAQRQ